METTFWGKLKAAFREVFANPKKLIPAGVLAVIWLIFSILSVVGQNTPFVRLVSGLTYSNGGLYGGVFGAIGGLFGKAAFAAVITGLVSAIVEKRNPFRDCGPGIKGAFREGAVAAGPFMLGAGAGLILYAFFNVTAAPRNMAVAAAAAIGALTAVSKKNGLLFSAIFGAAEKLSKGKTPSFMTVNRVISGLAAGFLISLPLTLVQRGWIILAIGAALLAAGIVLACGKKQAVTMLMVGAIIAGMLGFATPTEAAGKKGTVTLRLDTFYYDGFGQGAYRSSDWDQWLVTAFAKAGDITISTKGDTFTLPSVTDEFGTEDDHYNLKTPALKVKASPLVVNEKTGVCTMTLTVECGSGIKVDAVRVYYGNNEYTRTMTLYEFTLVVQFADYYKTYDYDNGTSAIIGSIEDAHVRHSAVNSNKPDAISEKDGTPTYFNTFHCFTVVDYSPSGNEKAEKPSDGIEAPWWAMEIGDPDNPVNPVDPTDPDNPTDPDIPLWPGDWPHVLTAVLTAILGALLGAAGGALGGAAGAAAGDIFDGNPFISRDRDGDLVVKDPVNGENRTYVANGDGTYTNPLTGATYTESELADSVSSRADNAGLLAQDEATKNAAIAAQREDNQKKSDIAEQYETQKHKDEEALKQEELLDKMWLKYGGERGDKDSIMAAAQAAQEQNQKNAEDWNRIADNIEMVEKAATVTVAAADTAIDVLENYTGPVGTAIKYGYVITKNGASKLSEAIVNMDANASPEDKARSILGALGTAGFNSLADITQDKLGKLNWQITGSVASDGFKKVISNLEEGKDWNEGLGGAAMTGAMKGGVDKFASFLGNSANSVVAKQKSIDMAGIAMAEKAGMSQKGLRALRDMRLLTAMNNQKAATAANAVLSGGADLSKLTIDGVTEKLSEYGGKK